MTSKMKVWRDGLRISSKQSGRVRTKAKDMLFTPDKDVINAQLFLLCCYDTPS